MTGYTSAKSAGCGAGSQDAASSREVAVATAAHHDPGDERPASRPSAAPWCFRDLTPPLCWARGYCALPQGCDE